MQSPYLRKTWEKDRLALKSCPAEREREKEKEKEFIYILLVFTRCLIIRESNREKKKKNDS